MKRAGFTAQVDSVGRLVIPRQIRKQFGIDEKSVLEIFTTDSSIVLKKYQQSCAFCNDQEDIVDFRNLAVCKKCLSEIKNLPI